MKFINYTNDGRVVVQHAALILSKLDETDTLELHTMDNAIILLKKDMQAERTLAVKISAELFDRLKEYLEKNHLKQKDFITQLLQQALDNAEE
ncbi:MAG: hypothetical protein SPG84_01570 [Vescimonas sp.]|uniref:hypothetical protein n=1 Tax=Vescimonas sp. TaxID=2892404 RepID=UPI002A90E9DB|nr:hypothetical protein [Vescimonas sp.]MDY5333572.1 hypothetical protein [Vescimonas sp.]